MVRIVANHNKQDVTYSCTLGQTFPDIDGKLVQLEVNGKELSKLLDHKEIPICSIDTSYLIWHGKAAGHILKLLREIWNQPKTNTCGSLTPTSNLGLDSDSST